MDFDADMMVKSSFFIFLARHGYSSEDFDMIVILKILGFRAFFGVYINPL